MLATRTIITFLFSILIARENPSKMEEVTIKSSFYKGFYGECLKVTNNGSDTVIFQTGDVLIPKNEMWSGQIQEMVVLRRDTIYSGSSSNLFVVCGNHKLGAPKLWVKYEIGQSDTLRDNLAHFIAEDLEHRIENSTSMAQAVMWMGQVGNTIIDSAAFKSSGSAENHLLFVYDKEIIEVVKKLDLSQDDEVSALSFAVEFLVNKHFPNDDSIIVHPEQEDFQPKITSKEASEESLNQTTDQKLVAVDSNELRTGISRDEELDIRIDIKPKYMRADSLLEKGTAANLNTYLIIWDNTNHQTKESNKHHLLYLSLLALLIFMLGVLTLLVNRLVKCNCKNQGENDPKSNEELESLSANKPKARILFMNEYNNVSNVSGILISQENAFIELLIENYQLFKISESRIVTMTIENQF